MRRASTVMVVLLVLTLAALAAQGAENCPPVTTLADKTGWTLGSGRYRAQKKGDTVTVTATGESSTAGFKVQLAREPTKIFPPRLVLYHKPPDGVAAQVVTPFTVCATFPASRNLAAVTVRDNTGEHRVVVENAP